MIAHIEKAMRRLDMSYWTVKSLTNKKVYW